MYLDKSCGCTHVTDRHTQVCPSVRHKLPAFLHLLDTRSFRWNRPCALKSSFKLLFFSLF